MGVVRKFGTSCTGAEENLHPFSVKSITSAASDSGREIRELNGVKCGCARESFDVWIAEMGGGRDERLNDAVSVSPKGGREQTLEVRLNAGYSEDCDEAEVG